MTRKPRIRKIRGTAFTPESSARANKARWAADRARRAAEEPAARAELALHPIVSPGDPIQTLELRDLRSGEIRRWTVLQGPRTDQVILRHPDGRRSRPMGWSRLIVLLRPYLAGRR